jgi:hypothetical protein
MDVDRFDALTRSLVGATPSRRRLLTAVAGSGLGALATALGFAEADATHFGCRHVGSGCRRSRQCCSSRCQNKQCQAHDAGICTAADDACGPNSKKCGQLSTGERLCECFVTTGGASFCGGYGRTVDCTKDKQCEAEFGSGAACVACGDETFCVGRCDSPD